VGPSLNQYNPRTRKKKKERGGFWEERKNVKREGRGAQVIDPSDTFHERSFANIASAK